MILVSSWLDLLLVLYQTAPLRIHEINLKPRSNVQISSQGCHSLMLPL